MTTPTIEDDTDDDVDVPGARTPKLGAGVMHRLRLPGPGRDTTRPAPIGSVASSSARFATGLARSVPSRHQLRGPQNADVQSIRNVNSAPPRWWSPDLVPPGEDPAAAAPLTPRGLPRAVHSVPSDSNRTPGGILGGLASTTVPVRRMDAVTAAGPMLTSHDKQKLSAVAVNRSLAQQAASAAPSAAAPAVPTMPAAPVPAAAGPPPQQRPPTPPVAAPPSTPPTADLGAPEQPPAPAPSAEATTDTGPTTTDTGPTTAGPARPADGGAGAELTSPVAEPIASAEPARPRFRPERRSRLASVRGPAGGSWGAAGGFPRSVGALALAGADPLASPVTDTPAHIRPLPRMVGGGHAVSAAANAGQATVSASDPMMFRAGRSAAEQPPAAATPPATGLAGVPSITTLTTGGTASGPAPAAAPSGTAAVDDAVATGGSAPAVAPGGGRGRRRASSEAVGIGLATTRSLRATRGGDEVRPALSTSMLPALGTAGAAGAVGAMAAAGAAHAWLPGAEQRAAGARSSIPGALSLPGRAAGLGMSDLLPSARGLAGSAESVTGPLASAFGAADPITPAGSAAAAAPAPPTAAAAADAGGAPSDAVDASGDTASPLRAARRRARSRLRSAATGAAATGAAATGATATGATATGAAASAAGSASALGLPAVPGAAAAAGMPGPAGAATLGSALTPLKRLTETTSGSPPATHMPAPPPVSIRSSAGSAVPPMSAAAGLASGGTGGLKRSLIDITAGMFDNMPGSTDAQQQGSSAPPVPAVAQSDIRGSDMAEAERRLQVVRDGDTAAPAPSPLDDPIAMDTLVDEVVQRIEARVIDELERRGRRHNPGVF